MSRKKNDKDQLKQFILVASSLNDDENDCHDFDSSSHIQKFQILASYEGKALDEKVLLSLMDLVSNMDEECDLQCTLLKYNFGDLLEMEINSDIDGTKPQLTIHSDNIIMEMEVRQNNTMTRCAIYDRDINNTIKKSKELKKIFKPMNDEEDNERF